MSATGRRPWQRSFRRLVLFPWNDRWPQLALVMWLLHWLVLAVPVGILAGSASALFLVSLHWVTEQREANLWIIAGLPGAGLLIGLVYHYWGESVVKGNNQLMEQCSRPTRVIPLRMAPLVLFGTLVTHLFGGSAGREGTAVQMGGAIADQFTYLFHLGRRERKILIMMGVSAGFASVFGTPLAATVFALEVLILGRMRYEALLPCFMAAVIGDSTCLAWGVAHTHYPTIEPPAMSLTGLVGTLVVGLLCGLTAALFAHLSQLCSRAFQAVIAYPPLRPLIGGLILAVVIGLMGTTRYIGLGIPVIESAFTQPLEPYAFLLKIVLTAFTLGAGFKGGEVTPLFFIGATLGNALIWIIPLPLELLVGMGFVAVFAGATNTPLACTLMGIELFGAQAGVYLGLACAIAYLFSGHAGIYEAQIIGSPKHPRSHRHKGGTLSRPLDR